MKTQYEVRYLNIKNFPVVLAFKEVLTLPPFRLEQN